MSAGSRRLDVAVAEQLGASRAHAQALILEGRVRVDGAPAGKAGALIAERALIEVTEDSRYVSRGGAKLEHALVDFEWSVAGLRCLDVGASTGGFTDCLLQRGAAAVTALDVGYGQLAWALRNDPRVTVVERCNFRYADLAAIGAPFEFVCIDVSFISLATLSPALAHALTGGGRLVALVKPQFEAGRRWVKRGGVVRDEEGQREAIESLISALRENGFEPVRLTHSPIKGPAGNIEFLLGAERRGVSTRAESEKSGMPDFSPAPVATTEKCGMPDFSPAPVAADLDVAGAVKRAHEALDR